MAYPIKNTKPVMGTSGFSSTKAQAIYDKILLTRVVQNRVHSYGAQNRKIRKNSNAKKGFAYRYKNMLPALTPLAQYDGTNIIRPNKIVREEVEYGIEFYGDYVTVTDELDLLDYDNIKDSFLDILGDQAALTADTLTRDKLYSGTNVIYAKSSADRAAVATGKVVFEDKDFDLAELKLRNQGAKKFTKAIEASVKIATRAIKPAYIAIVAPAITHDLRDLSGWREVTDYADYSKRIDDNEVGSRGAFRFLESDNAKPVDVSGTNVWQTIVFGEDAYAEVQLRGKGKVKTLVEGFGGKGDPLSQYQTLGWKMTFGAAILNQAWLIRLESVSTLEDKSVKHYMDYTPRT